MVWLCPSIALGARRLHDIGSRGWWLLIAFTGIGIIPLIIWLVRPGDSAANDWGPPEGGQPPTEDASTGPASP